MPVTWWTASGIILHHWSIAYEFSIYCSPLIYFPVAIAIITTKYPKTLLFLSLLLLPLPSLSYYFATKHFAADTKFPGVVELTIQLLILENILWLPLRRINKFGLNTLPLKVVAIPYTCGLSALPLPRHSIHRAHSFFSLGRSPRVSTTPFRHTPIDKPLQRCLPTTYTRTFNLLLYVSLPRVSHTVPLTCKLSPLFSSISQPHTPPPI